MDKKKNIVSKKLNQMEILLELIEDLTHSSDCIVNELSCATTLIKGIKSDISAALECD